jgi:hypothetical protein
MSGAKSDLSSFLEAFNHEGSLRRRSVGIVAVALSDRKQAVKEIGSYLPDVQKKDVLASLSPIDIERLTASRLVSLCIPEAVSSTNNPTIILNFEALFSTLDKEMRRLAASKLAAAEPVEPYLILVHSMFSCVELQGAFRNNHFHWWSGRSLLG